MIKKPEPQLKELFVSCRKNQSYRPISALYKHIEPTHCMHYTHKLSYYYDHQSWTPHLNLDKDNEKDSANVQYQHLIEEHYTPVAKTLLEYEIPVCF